MCCEIVLSLYFGKTHGFIQTNRWIVIHIHQQHHAVGEIYFQHFGQQLSAVSRAAVFLQNKQIGRFVCGTLSPRMWSRPVSSRRSLYKSQSSILEFLLHHAVRVRLIPMFWVKATGFKVFLASKVDMGSGFSMLCQIRFNGV